MHSDILPINNGNALQQLRSIIDSDDFSPGDRLPSERHLINALGVTRTALRKALDILEREGVIWRHVGKGTFITAHLSVEEHAGNTPSLAELSHHMTPIQMMRTRLALEPAIAKEAAANASAEALRQIKVAHDRALTAKGWDSYEADDDAFHRSIASATGNILLLSLFDHMNQVRRAVAWRQVIRKTERPPKDHPSFLEHSALIEAIERRDPDAAHGAMREHLSSVSRRLYGDENQSL